jgi:hypothetical protein
MSHEMEGLLAPLRGMRFLVSLTTISQLHRAYSTEQHDVR